MSLVLRIGRWSLTLFEVAIDDEDDGPFVEVTSATETALGFVPPQPWYDDED